MERTCENCGKSFTGRPDKRFCGQTCRSAAHYARHPEMKAGRGTSAGTSGAISELVVCADLLCRGYEVFRSQSPACSCDLIAGKDGDLLKVEVKTGYRKADGSLSFPRSQLKPGAYDVIAIVDALGAIQYEPEL